MAIDVNACRYQAMIGVGGIGSGMFVALEGNHTLGREESRSGRFLDWRDYCKLHIVSHYVKSMLGPAFKAILIGRIGADEIGDRLLAEMEAAGLDLRYVTRDSRWPTLFGVCFLYPDGSGGNITSSNSACAQVDSDLVSRAEAEFSSYAGRGIALALPEVPLEARRKLLELGTQHGFWRVASFTSAEMQPVAGQGWLDTVDLLAVNLDEAAAAAGLPVEDRQPKAIVEAAVNRLSSAFPSLRLSITAGRHGSWSWDGQTLAHQPIFPVKAVGTAGAGDAHLAGIIAGVTTGLSLAQAQELGSLVAAMAVTSPHTINKAITPQALRAFAARLAMPVSDAVRAHLRPM